MSIIRHEQNGKYPATGYEGEPWTDQWLPPTKSSWLRKFLKRPQSSDSLFDQADEMLDFGERFGIRDGDRPVNTPRPYLSILMDKFLEIIRF